MEDFHLIGLIIFFCRCQIIWLDFYLRRQSTYDHSTRESLLQQCSSNRRTKPHLSSSEEQARERSGKGKDHEHSELLWLSVEWQQNRTCTSEPWRKLLQEYDWHVVKRLKNLFPKLNHNDDPREMTEN